MSTCEVIRIETPTLSLEEIEKSLITTYRRDIFRLFVKAINTYQLIEPGDKIAIGVSGGKDSLLLAKLFQELKRHNKVILFIDEADAVFPRRSGNDNNREDDRTLAQFLTCLDGFFSSNLNCLVFAATNRKDKLHNRSGSGFQVDGWFFKIRKGISRVYTQHTRPL